MSAKSPKAIKIQSKKGGETMDVVLIGCSRWSPRVRPEVFHARDENGNLNIHTVPKRVGLVLLKKRSMHGVRYFRKARPNDYKKQKGSGVTSQDEVDLSDEEAFADYDDDAAEVEGEEDQDNEVEVEDEDDEDDEDEN